MDDKSSPGSEKSALITQAVEKVRVCISCDHRPPEGRMLLVWELPLCGGCSVVARRTLEADPTLNGRLARVIARVLAHKGLSLGDSNLVAVVRRRPAGATSPVVTSPDPSKT